MNAWLEQIFGAKIAQRGGLVRRKKADVHRYASLSQLLREVERRGWHLIETGDQYVIVCNKGTVRLHR